MHTTRKINDHLVYLGGSDRRQSRFENLFPIPRGVSYNSYLLLDEKTVLFDTADESVGRLFFENLEYALNARTLDYLVIHHMEPDHCVLLEEVRRRWPEVKLVCSAKALGMMSQFFGADMSDCTLMVGEGDKLSTGRHTLHFLTAPMVHWPEVIMTYEEVDKLLFTADAFGTFGALSGNIFTDEFDFDKAWMDDARRYYANVCGKYGAQVQAILKKISALDIGTVCPLHGPVWRGGDIAPLLEKYQQWSTYQPEGKAVMIAYATMYGNTENAAAAMAGLLAEKGVRGIAMYDLSETDVSELAAESFRCSHLVLAAPTYNGGLHPKMEAYLHDIKALGLQNRTVALLENGTWAPVAARHMATILGTMKNMTVLENPVAVKSALAEGQLAALDALADTLAAQLCG